MGPGNGDYYDIRWAGHRPGGGAATRAPTHRLALCTFEFSTFGEYLSQIWEIRSLENTLYSELGLWF